jgi:hypothetical protein
MLYTECTATIGLPKHSESDFLNSLFKFFRTKFDLLWRPPDRCWSILGNNLTRVKEKGRGKSERKRKRKDEK